MMSTNPYVGLRPFDSKESLLFFGRNNQTLDLLQRLHEHHFVAVVGSSGSGKSSLVRAGLIPALKAGYLVEDSDKWHIAIMKPGQHPVYNLAESILEQLSLNPEAKVIATLSDKIEAEGADAILDLITPVIQDKNSNFFLLIDQFEELFRFSMEQKHSAQKDEAIDFVNIILELAQQSDVPFYIVSTMRSDFIGDCAQFYGLPEAMNNSQYLVPRLNRQQLKMVIEGPAKLFGGKVNSSLTSKLLNELGKVKDELPLLQHVLMRIWDYEMNIDKSGVLDLKDYQHVGGIEKALSFHADEALADMNDDEKEITKDLFKALTAIDDNGRKIRRPVRLSELKALTGSDEEQLLHIIDCFIKDRRSFLMMNNVGETNDKVIDISHESLIRQWHTLGNWVDDEDEAASYYKQLVEATQLNALGKRDLLSGIELQLALEWRKKFKPVKVWANRYREGFDESIIYLNESEAAWTKFLNLESKKKKEKKLTYAILGLMAILVIGSVFATQYIMDQSKELRIRDDAFKLHFTALDIEKDDPTLALRLEENALKIHEFRSFSDAANDMYKKHSFYKNVTQDYSINGIFTISPDGKSILTASLDSDARLYSIDKKDSLIAIYKGHKGPITSVAFSHDGLKVLTGSIDKTAKLWHISGEHIATLKGHHDAVLAVAFSHNSALILTGSKDNTATVWDLSGKPILNFEGDNSKGVTCVAFSNDEKHIATGNEDGWARIWNMENGTMTNKVAHAEEIWTVSFSSSGNEILAASEDATAGLYNIVTGDTIQKYTLHSAAVTSAVFSPNEKSILTGSRDGTSRLWTIGGKTIQKFVGQRDEVVLVEFTPDGKQVLTGSTSLLPMEGLTHDNSESDHQTKGEGQMGSIKLWDIKNNVLEFRGHEEDVKEAVFSPDGKFVLTASLDSTIHLWDLQADTIRTFDGHDGDVQSLAFSSDGTKFISGAGDKEIKLWDTNTGAEIKSFIGHTQSVLCVAFSPDDSKIVSGSFDGNIIIWDLNDNSQNKVPLANGGIWDIEFSPDGTKFLAGCEDGTSILFDLNGEILKKYLGHTDASCSVAFSPDGSKILSGSEDFTARLYSIDGTLLQDFKHEKEIFGVAFTPDGKSIVTGSDDPMIGIWDLNGNILQQITGHFEYVNSVAISPNGNFVLASVEDGNTLLYDLKTSTPMEDFLKNGTIEPLSNLQKAKYEIED
jgi:WD40 repeat protein